MTRKINIGWGLTNSCNMCCELKLLKLKLKIMKIYQRI